jgi:hypothetical protein
VISQIASRYGQTSNVGVSTSSGNGSAEIVAAE